jgi:hypothetical protein
MAASLNDDALWESLAAVLIRCFLIGIVFLALWFLAFLLAGDWILSAHSRWFQITARDLHLMNYGGMLLMKACLFLFFLAPYISIRLMLAGRNGTA